MWIRPGGGLAEDYLALLESFTDKNTEATILLILGVFALFHSGLAGLRPQGKLIATELPAAAAGGQSVLL